MAFAATSTPLLVQTFAGMFLVSEQIDAVW
jgi:hypothetical protein